MFVHVLQIIPFVLMSGCQIILSSLLDLRVRFLSQNFKAYYRKILNFIKYYILILNGCDSIQYNVSCSHVTPVFLLDPHTWFFFTVFQRILKILHFNQHSIPILTWSSSILINSMLPSICNICILYFFII